MAISTRTGNRSNSGFRRSTVLDDGSTAGEVVRLPGEGSTSVPDLIQGEWETREIYIVSRRLTPPAGRSPWPGTRRTDSGAATSGRTPHGSRSRCCAPPTGRVPSPTTKRSSGR